MEPQLSVISAERTGDLYQQEVQFYRVGRKEHMKQLKKTGLILLGLISLTTGIIGIFLPVLPTTPLLLLASWCFLNSSEKLYRWLMTHPIFGYPIFLYREKQAVHKKTKINALIFLWIGIGISIALVDNSKVDILLLIILIAVSIHIIKLKTINEEIGDSLRGDYQIFCDELKS